MSWLAGHELDAAGITDPALRHSYLRCRRLNAEHGRTYYLATLLLPAASRPFVHALYGFARYADDLVDDLHDDAQQRADRFAEWTGEMLADLDWGATSDPIGRALLDTLTRFAIPHSYLADFLDSMRSDLTVTEYATYDDLARYMWGSAAVIGLQMTPILGRVDDSVRWDELEPYAIDLGIAFQLTNFLRDVGDDLRRGRIYLPQDSLREFGVDRERLLRGEVDEPIRNLLAFEIERTREVYRRAEPGIALVHPSSQECLRVAATLYGEILDQIERRDYDVLSGRASVPLRRRAVVGARGLTAARAARRLSDVPATPSSTGSTGSLQTRTARLRQVRKRFVRR